MENADDQSGYTFDGFYAAGLCAVALRLQKLTTTMKQSLNGVPVKICIYLHGQPTACTLNKNRAIYTTLFSHKAI